MRSNHSKYKNTGFLIHPVCRGAYCPARAELRVPFNIALFSKEEWGEAAPFKVT